MDKQLTFFDTSTVSDGIWCLSIDGASRNNPGPSGVGIVIKHNDKLILEAGYFLGAKTNNQAEYLSLLLGLCHLQEIAGPKSRLHVITDSQLLARQITGHYRVKEPILHKMHARALKLLSHFNYTVQHVLREKNKEADKMANHGVDKRVPVPLHFVQILHDLL